MELLKKLYEIHSHSGDEENMRKFIKSYCKSIGCRVERKDGNIYVTKGTAETYPCIASHIDQVQTLHSPDFKVFNCEGVLFGWSQMNRRQEGLGADDKNGIWVALRCLERYDAVKACFFWGEEIGCCGSMRADMKFFSDCRFVLQCDRRNSGDLITDICGQLCSDEFLAAIPSEEFGYAPVSGLTTDVGTLKENGLSVSCVNMSCGYYAPHTDHETTVFSELENCLAFVSAIIERCTEVYPHESCSHSFYGDYYGRYYYDYYCNRPSGKSKTKGGKSKKGKKAKDTFEHDMEFEACLEDVVYTLSSGEWWFDSPSDLMAEYDDIYPSLDLDDFAEILSQAQSDISIEEPEESYSDILVS